MDLLRKFDGNLTDLQRKLMCTSLIMLDADMEVGSEGKMVVSSYYVLYLNRHNYDKWFGKFYIQRKKKKGVNHFVKLHAGVSPTIVP